jgi:hypothetical protein
MQQENSSNDEISIGDILVKLWRRRGLIVIIPILSGALGVFAVLLTATQISTPVVHYVNLTGIEKGKYPNGVDFSPRDLQSPEVLRSLASEFGIEQTEDFGEAVRVSYGAPTTEGILKKYQVRLSQKGLKAAEVDAINAELKEELRSATAKTAQIAIDFQSIGVNEGLAAQMAIALPTIWADVFTTKFRVLDSTQLSGLSQAEKLSLDSAAGVLEASDYVDDMLRGLKVIEEDGRLSGLQTGSGTTAADLHVRVENFNNLYLSAILSRNLGGEDSLTKFYKIDLSLMINMIDEQVEGINGAIDSIQSVISGEANSVAAGQSYGADRMQVTGDAISDIVNLVNKSSLSEYLTELYEKKQLFIRERSELNRRLSKFQEEVEFGSDLIKISEDKLNALNQDYVVLLVAAREMNRQNNKTLGQSLGSPHRAGSLIPKRGILIILLSVVAGGLLAVGAALLMPDRGTTKS